MNYEDYIQLQIGGEGHLNKPIRYAKGEQRAIDWFLSNVYKETHAHYYLQRMCKILDIGCGEGWALNYLERKYCEHLYGIDLHPEKIEWARLKTDAELLADDFNSVDWGDKRFDIFWCSHSLEHFHVIDMTLLLIKKISNESARLWVVLPYPDLDPAPAHTASVQLGLNIDDEGKTVIKFFEDRGFKLVRHKFDDYREPEIWLDLVKSDE